MFVLGADRTACVTAWQRDLFIYMSTYISLTAQYMLFEPREDNYGVKDIHSFLHFSWTSESKKGWEEKGAPARILDF